MTRFIAFTLATLLLPAAAQAGGVVKLSQSGNGTLKITGDNAPNHIIVIQNAFNTHVTGIADEAGPTVLRSGSDTNNTFAFGEIGRAHV